MIECRSCRRNPATHMYDLCKDCYFTPTIVRKFRDEAKAAIQTNPHSDVPAAAPITADDFIGDGCYTKKMTAVEMDKPVVTTRFGPMDVSKTNSLDVVTTHAPLADTIYSAKETGRWSASNPPQANLNKQDLEVSHVKAMIDKNYRYNVLTLRQRRMIDQHKYPRPLPESHQIIGKAKQITADFITGKLSRDKLATIFTDLSDNDWPLYCQLRMYADCIKSCDIKRLKEVLECVILNSEEQARIGVALAMSVFEEQPVSKWAGFSEQLRAALPSLMPAFNNYLSIKANATSNAHCHLATESPYYHNSKHWLVCGQTVPMSPVVDAAVKVARDEPPIRCMKPDIREISKDVFKLKKLLLDDLRSRGVTAVLSDTKLVEVPFE